MQLDGTPRGPVLRRRLGAAVCMLLASGTPAAVRADPGTAGTAGTTVDASTLFYGENQRTNVVEPEVRVTRLFSNGQTLAGQVGLDVITGASPTGGTPNGQVQTVTSASGNTSTTTASQIPTAAFKDARAAFDGEWGVPIGSLFTANLTGHASKEKDYRSLGTTATFSLDVLHRRFTLTGGGGVNHDLVDPVGGTVVGLTDGAVPYSTSPQEKNVSSVVGGITSVVTRRWLLGVSGTQEVERGYLTEPYKVISVLDPATGYPASQLREKRPDVRRRNGAMLSSVYHFTDDVLYVNYRYYWDDWDVRSHTLDLKYRHDLPNATYIQPHLRLYGQTQAEFFRYFLLQGDPLPAYASSDERIGPLRSATIGATYGFRIPNSPGEWGVRAEYIRQWGDGHPADAPGVQQTLDQFPPLDIGSLLVTYSLDF